MNRTTLPLACLFLSMALSAIPLAAANNPPSPVTASTPAAPDVQSTTHHGVLDQDVLTGNWGGLRDKLEADGFKVSPTWTGEFFGNPKGGAAQGITEDGLFNVALDFDLGKMSDGTVEDLTIHTNALYIYGQGLSTKYVGDFSNTSNIAGYNSVRLQELWIEKLFFDKKLSVRVGNMAVDTEYFQSESSSLFINGTFGAPTLIANNIPNVPVYPVASPGVRVQVGMSQSPMTMALSSRCPRNSARWSSVKPMLAHER